MRKAIRHGALVLLVALAFVAISPSLSAQLPPAIQADRLLVQAERQIRESEFVAAVATLDQILALSEQHNIEIPVVFWFKHASAARGAGLYDRAIESATRYLQTAGQKGEHYLPTLELLDSAESAKQQEKQKREWQAKREKEQEREGSSEENSEKGISYRSPEVFRRSSKSERSKQSIFLIPIVTPVMSGHH